MRKPFALMLTGGLAACTEYNPGGEDPDENLVFNPADPPVRTASDAYEQIQKPEVDVLWIVDNSCSMGDEQEAVADNFPTFMQYFLGSNLDYHIGVVSTDMDNQDQSGKLIQAAGVRWITPDTPNPEETFAAMSQLGTGGSGDEQGILATYAALELQADYNAGFFREESALHIITVSDESDHSPSSPVTINEFKDYLIGLRQDPEMVSYHTIVSPAPPLFPCDGASTDGSRYIDVNNAVGGIFWSLCDRNWDATLELIGLESAGLKREYFLSERPLDGTVRVTVEDQGYVLAFDEYDPVTLLGDWTYSEPRNSVTFLSYVPNPGAVVHIDYDVLAAAERE